MTGISAATERYVVDTHALWWRWRSLPLLSSTAEAVFHRAATGHAILYIPAIVVAELYYLSAKQGMETPPTEILERLEAERGFEFVPLDSAQLALMEQFPEIHEMHDRMLVSAAAVLRATVVTRDAVLFGASTIPTLW